MRVNQAHRMQNLVNSPRRQAFRANTRAVLFILFCVLVYFAV